MAPKPGEKDVYLRITRPGDECLLCHKPLNIDGRHPSYIELSEKEEVIRKDFCAECWQRLGEESYFSFWLTKRVNAPSAQERRLAKSERNEALWRLFAALYSSDSPDLAPQLFLLAHLLMKYRVLAYQGTTEEGRLLFQHPKLGETFEIEDIPLDSVDFVAIKQSLEDQAVDYAPSREQGGTGGNTPEET